MQLERTQSGSKILGDFLIGRTLGEGTFGKVKLGTHLISHHEVALKFITVRPTNEERDKLLISREIKIMKLLQHQNIVKLHDVIHIPKKNTYCLVLEYIEGGELFEYIVSRQRLSEKEAARFFRQIISAIEYLHSNFIIHRDLKPENLLLDSTRNIKLNDFGLSRMMDVGHFLTSYCGSPHYSPPEILEERGYIGPEIDIWAMGVILFSMVTGSLPWAGATLQEQMKNALKASYMVPSHVSSSCKDLLSRMLCASPKERATIQELRQHPWVNQGYPNPPPTCLPPRAPVKYPDPSILTTLEELGFDEDEVKEELLSNSNRQSVILYHLINDSKNSQTMLKYGATNEIALGRRPSRNSLSVVPSFKDVQSATEGELEIKIPKNKKRHSWNAEKESKEEKGRKFFSFLKKKKNEVTLPVGRTNVNMKTKMTTEELQDEVERVLKKLNIVYTKKKKGTLFTCKWKDIKVKMRISLCFVDEEDSNLRGLIFKRREGNIFDYKTVYDSIIRELEM